MEALAKIGELAQAFLLRRWLRSCLGADHSVDEELCVIVRSVREGASSATLQSLPIPAHARHSIEAMAFPSSEVEFERAVEDFFIWRLGTLENIAVGERIALLESYLKSVHGRLQRIAPDVTSVMRSEVDRRVRNEPASGEEDFALTATTGPLPLARRLIATLYLMARTAGDSVDLLPADAAEAVEWLGEPSGRFPLDR